jgi:hypothetical protein
MLGKQFWSSERLIQLQGTLLLTLLVFLPATNAIELLVDPTLQFWIGSGQAWAWLMGCVGIIVLFLVTTQLFFLFGRGEWQNDAMVMYMGRTFVTILGIVLILQSFPLDERAKGASQMLLDTCSFSDRSQSLQNMYTKLELIRKDESCRSMRTVRQCSGFQANDYTEYIQWVEETYMCTGLCSAPMDVSYVEAPARRQAREKEHASQNDPYTTPGPVTPMEPVEEAGLVQANATRSKVASAERRAGVLAGQMPIVGNALFSQYTYEYHCGHMIATDLKSRGTAMADSTFSNGVLLLVLVLIQSAGELVNEARKPEPPKRTLSDAFVQP